MYESKVEKTRDGSRSDLSFRSGSSTNEHGPYHFEGLQVTSLLTETRTKLIVINAQMTEN